MPIKNISPDIWRQAAQEKENELAALYRERERIIVEQYNASWSKARIARYWSITLERVRQILKAVGTIQ